MEYPKMPQGATHYIRTGNVVAFPIESDFKLDDLGRLQVPVENMAGRKCFDTPVGYLIDPASAGKLSSKSTFAGLSELK